MRWLLTFVLVFCLEAQVSIKGQGQSKGHGFSGNTHTITVGNTGFDGPATGLASYVVWTPFLTPGGSSGYLLNAIHVNVQDVSSGLHIITGIYSNQTNPSNCPTLTPDCPNARICQGTSTVATNGDNITGPNPSDCGTLSSSTMYWLAVSGDNFNAFYNA